MSALSLRPATEEDRERVFDWANDATTRAMSFHTDEIPWEDHVRWYAGALASADKGIYLAEDAEGPVGVLRVDRDDDEAAVVGINVAPDARGRGLGVEILNLAPEVARARGFARLIAFIRPENAASHKVFQRAGYAKVEATVVAGQDADRYELRL